MQNRESDITLCHLCSPTCCELFLVFLSYSVIKISIIFSFTLFIYNFLLLKYLFFFSTDLWKNIGVLFVVVRPLSLSTLSLKVSYECDNFLPPSFVSEKTQNLNIEFLFLPTDIIRQESQFGHVESFPVMRYLKFFNSFDLFVSFKCIDCSVSTFCEEKTTLPFVNNGYLGNTVARKIPKENRSDFQFTCSLERNRIFLFVGK